MTAEETQPLRRSLSVQGVSSSSSSSAETEARAWQWGLISIAYAIFLLVGTSFYAVSEGYGWSKGHFYAVNVGLNIGWNWDEEESDGSKTFSIFYFLTGYTALALFVVFIGEQTYSGERRRKALVRHLECVELQREVEAGLAQPESFFQACLRILRQHAIPLHQICASPALNRIITRFPTPSPSSPAAAAEPAAPTQTTTTTATVRAQRARPTEAGLRFPKHSTCKIKNILSRKTYS